MTTSVCSFSALLAQCREKGQYHRYYLHFKNWLNFHQDFYWPLIETSRRNGTSNSLEAYRDTIYKREIKRIFCHECVIKQKHIKNEWKSLYAELYSE